MKWLQCLFSQSFNDCVLDMPYLLYLNLSSTYIQYSSTSPLNYVVAFKYVAKSVDIENKHLHIMLLHEEQPNERQKCFLLFFVIMM